MNVSDSDLITRVLLNDDRHAFATLLRRYQSTVRGLLRRLTGGNEPLADDLAQETFIKAYRSLASFRGNAKFSTWLHRIAYNAFISHMRSVTVTENYDAIYGTNTVQSNEMNDLNLQHDLESAMQELNEAERLTIHICFQCGFSHSEAAEILQQPLGTIKTNIARGKDKLRQQLSAWQEGIV